MPKIQDMQDFQGLFEYLGLWFLVLFSFLPSSVALFETNDYFLKKLASMGLQ